MKKLFVSLLAIAGLVACTNDEVVSVQQGNPIAFDTFVENTTRVGYDSSNLPEGFNVWAFIETENGNRSTILDAEDVERQGDQYVYGNTQYWVPDNTYYFAALAPMDSQNVTNLVLATGDAAKKGLGTFNFYNDNGTEDLIYAVNMVEASETTSKVTFTFKHLLSKVKFSFTNTFDNANYSIEVRDIEMIVPMSGNVNLAADDVEWTPGSTSIGLNFSTTGIIAKDDSANSAELLTIPAGDTQVYDVNFFVDLYVGNGTDKVLAKTYKKESQISGIKFEAGKAYNFAANINAESLELSEVIFDASVGGWDPTTPVQLIDTAAELRDAFGNENVNHIILDGNIDLNDLLSAGTNSTRAGENAGLVIPAGKPLTLDLNGFTISARDYATAGYALITNKRDLTINGEGTLKITGADNNRGWGAYSSVISNQPGGNLTVNAGVTIEHLGGTDMAYGIDNLTNGKGTSAIVTINGATVKSTYRPIRQFLNGVEAINELYVNKDSRVESTGGNKAIWMQDPSKNANTGKLVVAEGAFVHSVYLDVTPGSTEWPVEVSVAASSLTDTSDNKGIYTDGIPAGYEVVNENGVWTVVYTCAAKIGNDEYPSLQAAVEAVKDGETILLNRNIEQVDGVIITDKNITIDLNNKTFTVSEGANTNNRNFKVNGSSVVTIKNGTMVAAGELTSGAYGTVRTEGTANVTLKNVKLYNYRGNGLNVKVCTGTTVTINNSEIYSQYGGGVEAAGGIVELNDVKIDQKGVYSGSAWCSVAIGVNGGGEVTVNSGNYSASAISTDANAAQGTWIAYVMSSGGTLDIKGGTFNGVVAETAAAANACGLICADTKAIVNIYGGTFSSNGAILDMRNNTGGTPNPSATLFGGTFSADPRVSGLYSSNLITVAEGYVVKESDGGYTVVEYKPTAKVGNVEYGNIDDAIKAWTNNTTLTLMSDVTLSDVITLKSTEHHTLDLSTFTMTAASGKNAIEITPYGDGAGTAAKSCLTINADANSPGRIAAGSKACIYYYKNNGMNDRIMVTINGGVFDGTISSTSNNGGQACPYFVFNGGVFNKTINLSKAMLKVTGGTFHSMFSCTGDSTAHRLISGGTFKSWTWMTADAANKFCVGTDKQTYNVGVYVNADGYLVVGGPVITEQGNFKEKKDYSKWSSYLKYSSAAEYGLYYE